MSAVFPSSSPIRSLRACRRGAAYHRRMTTERRLEEALHGGRGLGLDADGVLVLQGRALPGSMEAVARLSDRGIPFRVVTNFSQLHRDTLAGWFSKGGLPIHPDRIITAASPTAPPTP